MDSEPNIIRFPQFFTQSQIEFNYGQVKLVKVNPDDQMSWAQRTKFLLLMINSVATSALKCAMPLFRGFADMLEATKWTVYLCFALNAICKFLSFAWQRHRLQKLTNELMELFPKGQKEQDESAVPKYWAEVDRWMRFFHRSHWAAALMFVLFPASQSSIEYMLQDKSEQRSFIYRLPYIIAYPFDINNVYVWIVAYVNQMAAGLNLSAYLLATDMYLVCCVQLLIMHFNHLATCIRKLKFKDGPEDLVAMSAIIKRHIHLLELCKRLDDAYSVPNFMHFMLWAIILCLIAFQVVAGSEVLDNFKFASFLISSFVDCYIICRWGSNLIDATAEVADAFFDHDWTEGYLRYQRMLPLAILRAQRPACLSALNFFDIDMLSFSSLTMNSYRFFALIRTHYDNLNATP